MVKRPRVILHLCSTSGMLLSVAGLRVREMSTHQQWEFRCKTYVLCLSMVIYTWEFLSLGPVSKVQVSRSEPNFEPRHGSINIDRPRETVRQPYECASKFFNIRTYTTTCPKARLSSSPTVEVQVSKHLSVPACCQKSFRL